MFARSQEEMIVPTACGGWFCIPPATLTTSLHSFNNNNNNNNNRTDFPRLYAHTHTCRGPPSSTDVFAMPQEPWLADPRGDPALPTLSAPHAAAEPGAVSTGCCECTSPSIPNAVLSCVHTHTSNQGEHHSSCCAFPPPSPPCCAHGRAGCCTQTPIQALPLTHKSQICQPHSAGIEALCHWYIFTRPSFN